MSSKAAGWSSNSVRRSSGTDCRGVRARFAQAGNEDNPECANGFRKASPEFRKQGTESLVSTTTSQVVVVGHVLHGRWKGRDRLRMLCLLLQLGPPTPGCNDAASQQNLPERRDPVGKRKAGMAPGISLSFFSFFRPFF